MSYVIEFTPEGTVAKMTCETIAELQAVLQTLGGSPAMRAAKPRRTKRRPAKRPAGKRKDAASAGRKSTSSPGGKRLSRPRRESDRGSEAGS